MIRTSCNYHISRSTLLKNQVNMFSFAVIPDLKRFKMQSSFKFFLFLIVIFFFKSNGTIRNWLVYRKNAFWNFKGLILQMKIFALRPLDETTRHGNGDIVPKLHNFCSIHDQNSLSPSLIKANMELNNARLHIL